MNKNRHYEINVLPWNTPADLTEKSYSAVLKAWSFIMWNSYVGILKMDPKSISIDRKKVKTLIS